MRRTRAVRRLVDSGTSADSRRQGDEGVQGAGRTTARNALWLVLPVSGMAKGKSRLAPVLSPLDRSRLNRQLVQHGVSVAVDALGMATRCIVVSPCARSLRIARAAGAVALAETRPARGLNAAIRQAVSHAMRQGARRVLILHSDLPRMSAPLLGRLLRIARPGTRSAVVPDRERVGTNALLCVARPGLVLHFGPDSYSKHCDSAREFGGDPRVFEAAALAQDLDTPEHLAQWLAAGRGWGR